MAVCWQGIGRRLAGDWLGIDKENGLRRVDTGHWAMPQLLVVVDAHKDLPG